MLVSYARPQSLIDIYWFKELPHDILEVPNFFVHMTQMLGQDEHQTWGPSSITIGETASSNVLKDFRKYGGCCMVQLTQKLNDHVNRSVVSLIRLL